MPPAAQHDALGCPGGGSKIGLGLVINDQHWTECLGDEYRVVLSMPTIRRMRRGVGV